LLGGLVWLAAQTDDFANDVAPADIWVVLGHTLFGHLLSARLVLLLIAAGLWAMQLEAGALLACAIALVLQSGHGHGVAMGGPLWLIAASALHGLAAGAWLGALPALAVMVAREDAPVAHDASHRFSRLGYGCVAVLLLTATAQFLSLIMGLPGLFGTAYGWMVCAKMLGFAALLVLAGRNRFWLTPLLAGTAADGAKSSLRRAIVAETAIGLLVVCAAGVLTELPPPMHVQPLWPFGWLPSLEAAREDPDIAYEVALYGTILAIGAARRTASVAPARAGRAYHLLSFAHRLQHRQHRHRQNPVRGKLRKLPWGARPWRRTRRESPVHPARRSHGRASLDAPRRPAFLVARARHRKP
jgi:putative copper resistance protein D